MENELVITNEDYEIEPFDKLSAEEKKKIETITNAIDVSDSEAVVQYGVNIQSEISEFSDSVLQRVQSSESGYVGEVLSELMVKVKAVDVDDIAGKKGFLAQAFSNMKNRFNRFMARYQKLGTQIDSIIENLDAAKAGLIEDISLLDTLHEKNLLFMKDLEYYITAGEMKIADLRENTLPALQEKAKASGDQMDAQSYNDMKQLVDRFEKKVHDLRLSRMITVQTAPQLRLIQHNDQVLVEKIQSSILNTIPLWKNQIVIAISLYRQQAALTLQKEVTDTTNELLIKNAELLKENTIGTATEAERGIVDLETLQKVNADLIETIDETMRIQSEGRAKRAAAEIELERLEEILEDKLLMDPVE
ncbi:MAG: toxic anion resistance protein [Eubacteriales bacterium]